MAKNPITLKDVKKRARELGASVEDTKLGNTHECTVTAPKFMTWRGDTGIHQLVAESYIPWKPDYEDMLDRMSMGLEPCADHEDGECEWCDGEQMEEV